MQVEKEYSKQYCEFPHMLIKETSSITRKLHRNHALTLLWCSMRLNTGRINTPSVGSYGFASDPALRLEVSASVHSFQFNYEMYLLLLTKAKRIRW
jgi:hypothetical protein